MRTELHAAQLGLFSRSVWQASRYSLGHMAAWTVPLQARRDVAVRPRRAPEPRGAAPRRFRAAAGIVMIGVEILNPERMCRLVEYTHAAACKPFACEGRCSCFAPSPPESRSVRRGRGLAIALRLSQMC